MIILLSRKKLSQLNFERQKGEWMVVYIAGRMRGCPNYEKRFKEAEEELKKQGHVVLNPAMLPKGLSHTSYMLICLSMIDASDAVYMLYGWEDSEGAKVEKAYADYNKKKIMRETRFQNEGI